ncbi:MAG: DMT family transporter [Bacteroidota bacterium]|nr:DMT family transporter [Bacteroidota bacterium]
MTKKRKAELALFATTFIWGGTFVIVKIGFESVSPFLFVALRFTIGSLFFALIFFRRLLTISRSALWKGTMLGLLLGVGLVLQTEGLQFTTASNSGFITGMMVVFTPLAQLFIERRLPKLGNVLGVVIVTFGLYLLTSPTAAGFNFGDLLTLIAAFLFGIYIVYLDIYTKEEETFSIVLIQTVCTALVGWSLVPFETPRIIFNMHVLGILFYTGILATVVTTYTQTRFQKDTTPTRAAIIFTLEPVLSAILAYIVLNEILGVSGIIGGALIVAGILISELSDSWLARRSLSRSQREWKFGITEEE